MFPSKCALRNLVLAGLFFAILPASAGELALMRVILNGEVAGEFFIVLAADNDVWMLRADLNRTRLKKGLGEVREFEGEKYVSLGSVAGLTFSSDAGKADLILHAEPSLFERQYVDVGGPPVQAAGLRGVNSAFLNYSLTHEGGDASSRSNVAVEAGGYVGNAFLYSGFNYHHDENEGQLSRELSYLRLDDRAALRTLVLGDAVTTAAGLYPEAYVLGGVSLTKNYDMDPYYSTTPPLALRGVLESASRVDLYVNGFRVQSEQLFPGQFVIDNIPGQSGLGTAEIVITDAFGRQRTVREDYYVSRELLRAGLTSYSHSLGLIREEFGQTSFSYGDIALLSSARRGWSNELTLGYAAAFSDGHANIGPSALWRMDNAGVLGAGVEFSQSGGRNGVGEYINYAYYTHRMSASLALTSYSRGFSTLSLDVHDPKPRLQVDASIGISAGRHGSVFIKGTRQENHFSRDMYGYGVFYSKSVSRRAHLFLNATRTHEEDQDPGYNVFLGMHVNFDHGMFGSIGFTEADDYRLRQASLQRNVTSDKGFGYRFQVDDGMHDTRARAEVDYHGAYGDYRVVHDDSGNYLMSASGGIGYIERELFFSRPISDGFAKVDLDGLAGVRVYYHGGEVGKTNADGILIVPRIRSFHNNRIEVEAADIPFDYRLSTLRTHVNPAYRSGVPVRFALDKIQFFGGRVLARFGDDLVPLEYGTMLVATPEGYVEGLIGSGGEFYIENLPFGKHAVSIVHRYEVCTAEIDVPRTGDVMVDLGELVCRVGE